MSNHEDNVHVEELSVEQSHQLFDQMCQKHLGVSREQFLKDYHSGNWQKYVEQNPDGYMDVWMALPFGTATDELQFTYCAFQGCIELTENQDFYCPTHTNLQDKHMSHEVKNYSCPTCIDQ